MKLHHIGVACSDIALEIINISKIHDVIKISPVVLDNEQEAELVLLTLADGTNIELIAGRQVEQFLKRNVSYYHLCFEVEDIKFEIERLLRQEAFLISPPKPAVLFGNREVAFLSVSYGIIELLSKNNS